MINKENLRKEFKKFFWYYYFKYLKNDDIFKDKKWISIKHDIYKYLKKDNEFFDICIKVFTTKSVIKKFDYEQQLFVIISNMDYLFSDLEYEHIYPIHDVVFKIDIKKVEYFSDKEAEIFSKNFFKGKNKI
ncbi:MAG: hypothetical protein ACOC1K_07750 [Nanoarchaeota archaeon]